jgi:hypothetical protein
MKKFSWLRFLILSAIIILVFIRVFPIRGVGAPVDCMPAGFASQTEAREHRKLKHQRAYRAYPVKYVLFGTYCASW